MEQIKIVRVLPTESLDLAPLQAAARSEDYAFVDRAQLDWSSGENRFDDPGEGFFVAYRGATIVGMCGLNSDPYLDDPAVGRLRHLYVAPEHRRIGLGRQLVECCLDLAPPRFDRVRLRTFETPASLFYEMIGFRLVDEPDATHSIDLAHCG